MKYSNIIRLLVLLVLMTRLHLSEGEELPAKIHSDDDLKPSSVAQTAPQYALPPNTARLAAAGTTDAAAARWEEGRETLSVRQQSAVEHGHGEIQKNTQQNNQKEETEAQEHMKWKGGKKLGHQNTHDPGQKKHRVWSKVEHHVDAYFFKQRALFC